MTAFTKCETLPAVTGKKTSVYRTTGNIRHRKTINILFKGLLIFSIFLSLAMLVLLLQSVLTQGTKYLTLDFFRNFSSRFPHKSGIRAAILGSVYIITLAAAVAFPIGIGTAIYLEEYAPKNKLSNLIRINIHNLSGVPAIVYGIFGLTIFVRLFSFDRSILSAGLTMGILILPIIIVSSQEAIKTVPKELKEASYSFGATKWQTIRHVILPYAISGILTGTILSVSRGLGEASPLVVVGGAASIWFAPKSIFDGFTTLPLQIYIWSGMPKAEFRQVAASGILVLLNMLFLINLLAIVLRNHYQNKRKR